MRAIPILLATILAGSSAVAHAASGVRGAVQRYMKSKLEGEKVRTVGQRANGGHLVQLTRRGGDSYFFSVSEAGVARQVKNPRAKAARPANRAKLATPRAASSSILWSITPNERSDEAIAVARGAFGMNIINRQQALYRMGLHQPRTPALPPEYRSIE
jgi:hypothetical protein